MTAVGTPFRRGLRVALLVVGAAAVLLGGLRLAGYLLIEGPNEDYRRFRSIEQGMSEQDVRRLLGDPTKVYEKGNAPQDYYVEGYARRTRPITNKVFIYVGGEPIAYVYFDKNDRVEEVFVGGS